MVPSSGGSGQRRYRWVHATDRAVAVAIASYSGLCVVDVWKTLERWSRGTEDRQGMACLPVYGIEWEGVR